MYTRAEHCTVFLDKAALTSCKLVRCCWPKKQDDKWSTLGEVSPWLVWAKESIMYVQSDRSHKPCQPSIICHGTAHAAADQWEPDCKSWSETQSNHFPPVTKCITHAESTCTNYYCNRHPWALGRGFLLQPQAKGHLHCFFTLGNTKCPNQTKSNWG